MPRLTLPAETEHMAEALAFVTDFLDQTECGMRARIAFETVTEEIFMNIVHYSGAPEAELTIDRTDDAVRLSFADRGVPFNPLAREDPDTTLSAEERNIGGLGIFMVKRMMDSVTYAYADGRNVLTVVKSIA